MNKEELRQFYLEKRNTIDISEFDVLTRKITEQLLNLNIWAADKTVHCFLPIETKNEFDTLPFIQSLWKLGCKVVVPVADFKTKLMSSALFTDDTPLTHRHNIPEPEFPETIDDATIDIIIVPLAIADKNGFRIGYGGGFYDRFISKTPNTYTIGVSFFNPIESIYPEKFDHPLSELITPYNCYTFEKQKTNNSISTR